METEQLRIRMLGEFSLAYGDNTVTFQDNRSRKVGTLLAYMIMFRHREIAQSELIDLLWSDEGSQNPANALKTMFHRVRATLDKLGYVSGHEIIVRRKGRYAWNTDISYQLDVDEFEETYKQGQASPDEAARLDCYRRAVALYRGNFLPLYNAEPWAVSISVYYHMLYIKLLHELIALLAAHNCHGEIVEICRLAIEIDPYEESLYYHQIKALVDSGNQQRALAQYENMKELFFSKFGVTPSDELQALYRQVVASTNSMQTDLNLIRGQLKETMAQPGAFYCEYEFFKDVYRIEARAAARSGGSLHLGLLTVSDAQGNKLNLRSLNLIMDKLADIIRLSLRRGDIYAKYSVSQFIIMLPQSNYENSRLVMERIIKRFRKQNPHSPARLSFSVQPLEPMA